MLEELNHIKDEFSFKLLNWYENNQRNLPWRTKKNDPYKIWLSEIMLQQTKVNAVIPYYNKFLRKWPTICSLAHSSITEILYMWSGLGYYNRANNMYKCAQIICLSNNGKFPDCESELIKLPGVGTYTAAAITSIAFGKRSIVIDTNVERIISRVLLIKNKIARSKKEIRNFLEIVTPFSKCADFPQALMDLGALICKKNKPKCEICPLSNLCLAYKNSLTDKIPLKQRKTKKTIRTGQAFILLKNNQILLQQRKLSGLLPGMVFLPSSGWDKNDSEIFKDFKKISDLIKVNKVEHEFSHFKLYLNIYKKIFTNEKKINLNHTYFWHNRENLKDLPMTSLLKKILVKTKLLKNID